jgi:methylated-DNA-[protein]-cysteine S-methyltransferase
VYDRLLRIPYGQVATYGEVARDIGGEIGAARAVGQAVGANPVAIIVPCHRVVAADGRLVGFGGGIARKAELLRVEGIDVDGSRPSSRVHPEIIRLPL